VNAINNILILHIVILPVCYCEI